MLDNLPEFFCAIVAIALDDSRYHPTDCADFHAQCVGGFGIRSTVSQQL